MPCRWIYKRRKTTGKWQKELKEYLYRDNPLPMFKCVELKAYSEPGEELGEFKVRLEQMASEKRDAAKEKLEKKYASKFSTLRDRIRRAEEKWKFKKISNEQSKQSSWISTGATLLGALMGRKMISATSARSAGTAMRARGRVSKRESRHRPRRRCFASRGSEV